MINMFFYCFFEYRISNITEPTFSIVFCHISSLVKRFLKTSKAPPAGVILYLEQWYLNRYSKLREVGSDYGLAYIQRSYVSIVL